MKNRKAWYNATTLAEVGELTAQWLTGDLDNHPGSYGVEEETGPIAATLARINRSGLVTYESQPGRLGESWAQKAAVSGFATPETWEKIRAAVAEHNDNRTHDDHLSEVLDLGRIGAFARPAATSSKWGRTRRADGVVVSEVHGKGACEFGRQMSERDINRYLFPYGNTEAIAEAAAALQVTVWECDPNTNGRLWTVLADALDTAEV